MTKRKKDWLCNNQMEEVQAMQWPKGGRTGHAMTKRKDRLCNDQKEGQAMQWPKGRRTGYAITKWKKGQAMQWPKGRRTGYAMTKRKKYSYAMTKNKDRLCNNQKEGKVMQ